MTEDLLPERDDPPEADLAILRSPLAAEADALLGGRNREGEVVYEREVTIMNQAALRRRLKLAGLLP